MTGIPAVDLAAAMDLALAAGAAVRGTTTPNPPVGAVVLDAAGTVVGIGATAPAGGPHAEVRALAEAGGAARGGTIVVTLEPCNHHGRTPPCTGAILAAGVSAVAFAVADPGAISGGGAATLRAAGLTVTGALAEPAARRGALREWLFRQANGRPHVTAKLASTLDGRIAAADGSSQWITGPAARAHAHAERAHLDAIVVGMGTVLADDPSLTARKPDGSRAAHQPLRVAVGNRPVPAGAEILSPDAPTLHLETHDPRVVLAELGHLQHVLIEGGPTLIAAFLRAGLVDRISAYLAPVLLGAGPAAVGDLGIGSITGALRFSRDSVTELGEDLLVDLVRR